MMLVVQYRVNLLNLLLGYYLCCLFFDTLNKVCMYVC